MSKRDEEINRLVAYAKALGCKVRFYNKSSPDYMAYIYTWDETRTSNIAILVKGMSKIKIIFSLIHEIAHLKAHIANGYKISDIDARIEKMKEPLPEWARKRILNYEANDMKFWEEIIKDCDINVTPERVYYQKQLDLIPYEYYYLMGKYPTKKIRAQLNRDLKKLKGKK